MEYSEELYKECTKILKPYVKAKIMGPLFRHMLEKSVNDSWFLESRDNPTLNGFCLARYKKRSNVVVLEKLAVLESLKLKGIGKLLTEELISICKLKKVVHLELSVVESNTNAVCFYKHLGFQEFSTKTIGTSEIKLVLMKMVF